MGAERRACLNYAALSIAVVITLAGTQRLTRRLEKLATTPNVGAVETTEPFREVNSVLGPVAASIATAAAFGLSALFADGWPPAILRGATWLLLGIPFWSFLWTYASLQLGLDRLGRRPLTPGASRADPTLGLAPIGSVASVGLWMLLAWLVPVVLTGLPDVEGVVIGVGLLAAALAAFFLSLGRLHRQMVTVKATELRIARELYAEAYEPVRARPTLETLEQQQSLLGAADALEKRAEAIQEWPIDDRTVTRVVTIATSVIASAVARLILEPVGL